MPNVITIDCEYLFPQFAASFLLIQKGERRAADAAAFIETGTTRSVPRLLDALQAQGFRPEQVQYVMVTHVHLDHSGGAYALMQACPNAQILAHPKAVSHLIDPSRLIAGAREVYGEQAFEELYGKIEGIEASRVRAVQDGETVYLGEGRSRALRWMETRGHANHHSCILDLDPGFGGIFTGDSFGLAYPALQKNGLFIIPSTSPTGFDPEAAIQSVDRILASGASRAFLTHFGVVEDLAAAAAQLRGHLEFSAQLCKEAAETSLSDQNLVEFCLQRLRAYLTGELAKRKLLEVPRVEELLKLDLELNAAGIAFTAQRRRTG